jgi:hypothetical protein
MRKKLLFVALALMPALGLASGQAGISSAPRPAHPYSQERLDRIRQSLTAQIAVSDQAEAAMRAPTPEEAAALARPSGDSGPVVALPDGGIALRQNGSQLSLAVATVGPDGALTVTHGAAPSKGVAHVR